MKLLLGELRESMPRFYVEDWMSKTNDQKRETTQRLLDELGGHLSPDPYLLTWLLETAGVDTDGR